MTRNERTLMEFTVEYYGEHPEEIEGLLQEAFNEFFETGDLVPMLFVLRVVAKIKGITKVAGEIDMTRQGLQKALSPNGNPRLSTLHAIMKALGYQLVPQKVAELVPAD